MPERAEASYEGWWADRDGYVPVYSACYPDVEFGCYYAYYAGYAVYGTNLHQRLRPSRLGAGTYDREQVIARTPSATCTGGTTLPAAPERRDSRHARGSGATDRGYANFHEIVQAKCAELTFHALS